MVASFILRYFLLNLLESKNKLIMLIFYSLLERISQTMNIELFKLGSSTLTIKTIILLLVSLFLLFFISGRATTIITNDNIAVIVPNSDFINKQVINWSHNNRNIRINIPVSVSYKEDPQIIEKLLISIARSHPGTLDNPPPYVRFNELKENNNEIPFPQRDIHIIR